MKTGDILIKRHTGLLPRVIQREMHFYRTKVLKLPAVEWEGNHVMIVVGDNLILDASAKGSSIKNTLQRYVDDPFVRHYTPGKLTKQQLKALSEVVTYYGDTVRPYDKLGLIAQSIYIHTGVWIAPKGDKSREKPYCSELAAIAIEAMFPNTFGTRTYKQNIVDIELCYKLKRV